MMCKLCIYIDIDKDHEEYPGQFDIIRATHEYDKLKHRLSMKKEARIDARFHAIHCTDNCGCEWRKTHNKS